MCTRPDELNQAEDAQKPDLPPTLTKDDLLKKIQDLSNVLLNDPYKHLAEIPELGKALAEYTNTNYTLGKIDKLLSFFLKDKSDLTGDNQIDHQDVIAFWENVPQMPEFPANVLIDLNNDWVPDYGINDGIIYHNTGSTVEKVDSIPGVDLKKLSDQIKQKFLEFNNNYQNPIPSFVKFDDDINGDGKIDHIVANTGLQNVSKD